MQHTRTYVHTHTHAHTHKHIYTIAALTGLPIGYSVIVALTGLPIGYSVIVALTGLPIGYSVIVALTGLPIGYTPICNQKYIQDDIPMMRVTNGNSDNNKQLIYPQGSNKRSDVNMICMLRTLELTT